MSSVPRIDALTGVRGIAAWYVVFYHVRESFAHALPAPVIDVLAKGYLAVDLFFVLSGFVLWLTWGHRFANEGWAIAPDFVRKRLARIWPLHAVVLTGCIAVAALFVVTNRPVPTDVVWRELPLHFLLIQNWGFTTRLTWNGPAWSISTEFAAYLLFVPCALLLAAAARWQPRVILFAAGGGVLTLAGLLVLVFAASGYDRIGEDVPGLGLVRCLVEFAAGVLICMAWQVARTALTQGAVIAGTIAVGLWATGVVPETFAAPLTFAALVPVLATVSNARANPLSSRVAVWLGEISYAVYLAHSLVWFVFKLMFVVDERAVPLMQLASFNAILVVTAWLLHTLVEVPARHLLGGNRRAPRTVLAA